MDTVKEFTPEESSSVRKIEYDQKGRWMDVTYKTGKIYRYSEFPMTKFLLALRADSIGSFLNDHVKGIHPYKLLN